MLPVLKEEDDPFSIAGDPQEIGTAVIYLNPLYHLFSVSQDDDDDGNDDDGDDDDDDER